MALAWNGVNKMALEKLFDAGEASRRELANTDYQIIREIEKLLPRLKQLLDDNGVDTTDVDLTKVDSNKRDHARARQKSEKAKKVKKDA